MSVRRALLVSLTACARDPDPPQSLRHGQLGPPGQPPEIVEMRLDLPAALHGGDATCDADTFDPDGDPVTVAWSWTVDGVDAVVYGASLPRAALGPGITVACTAVPDDGSWTGATVSASRFLGWGGNVLVVVLDDLGVDKVRVYAEHPDPPPTPTLDRLASLGLLVRRAYAQATCSPARAAMLTGRQPSRYGVGWYLDLREDWYLPNGEVTIPEMLRESRRRCGRRWRLGSGTSRPPPSVTRPLVRMNRASITTRGSTPLTSSRWGRW